MQRKVTTTATEPQGEFLSLPHRFRGFCGGYGSGKTFVGSISMCKNYWELPGFNQGYFAPTYPQIRDIFYPTIEEVADRMGLNVEINQGNKEVHFFSGRKYRGTTICRSMNNPGSIIGFKIGHAFIDEIDVMPTNKARTAWGKVLARMRYVGAKNSIDLTTTPEGFKFTYDEFVKKLAEDPKRKERYALVQVSTDTNSENLPEDYIPGLIEAYPKELVDAYIHGQFVNLTSGTVYRCFERNIHNSTEAIKEGETLFVGMDFNVQKMAAVVYVKRPSGWHAVDELKDIFDTPDMIEIIKDRFKKNKIIVYPDATGASRKSVDASRSDISLLKQAGIAVRVNSRNPAVKDRVLSVNKQFESGNLWVNTTKCRAFTESLEKQCYDNNGEPDKQAGFDHINDAGGYPIVYEFPIIKPSITVTSISSN